MGDRTRTLAGAWWRILFAAAACGVPPAALADGPAVDGVPHPAISRAPRVTMTADGRAGDPVNVAFIGSDHELHHTLARAGWYAADPITLETSLKIAADVVLRKPYPHAPVSNLYIWGRRQDVAFEQPVGNSPKQRHHVRFWRSREMDASGEPLWLGAATYDERVEISHATGGITHKIGADVDRERNKLMVDTDRSGVLAELYWIDRFHQVNTGRKTFEGRNGGGDPYFTDGRLAVGVLDVRR